MILVSACLAGEECRYDGKHNLVDKVRTLVEENLARMVCPEEWGGLSTPREPAEIIGGTGEDVLNGRAKVLTRTGQDVTKQYIQGAEKALAFAKEIDAEYVVLKERSPSCGSSMIYDGSFSHQRIPGEGVTTALLRKEGFKVISEEELAALLL